LASKVSCPEKQGWGEITTSEPMQEFVVSLTGCVMRYK
jgi:hypothetical protein